VDRELLLLGILRREAMHGYRLVEIVETGLRSCTDLKKPTAYFLLGKLARAGMVTRTRTREGKRPPKWVYRLTPKGEESFQAMLRKNLAEFVAPKNPGSAGLAFLDVLPSEEARQLLAQRVAALEAYAAAPAAQTPDPAGGLVTSLERAHLQAELAWLKDLLRERPGPGGRGLGRKP
jgi:DNA-binding PadR family transcriptional regulator